MSEWKCPNCGALNHNHIDLTKCKVCGHGKPNGRT